MGSRPGGERSLDRLFQLPPAEFVAARDALAASARQNGDTRAASAIRALSRPTVPAWIVNRLHRDHRAALRRLLDAGVRLRRLQESGRGGPRALQQAAERRRRAMGDLLEGSRHLLEGAGHTAAKAMLQRVERTLLALASGAAPGERPGRLTRELEPGGFESLGASPASRRAARREGRPRRSPEDPRLRDAVRRAKAALDRCDADLRRCQALVEEAAARAAGATTGLAVARRRLRAAEREAQRALRAVDRAADVERRARARRDRAAAVLASREERQARWLRDLG